jgi:hypothetical protein
VTAPSPRPERSAPPCPEIVTYERSGNPHAHRRIAVAPRWIAKYDDGGTLLPSTFEGVTELEARSLARQFWEHEQSAVAKARAARRAS